MAVPDILLLSDCAEFALSSIRKTENTILKELKTSGATRLIMGLRRCRLQRAVVAVGMFSLFESLLQDRMGWTIPFSKLPSHLKNLQKKELEEVFVDYRDAINVLKHGKGRSYEELSKRMARLEFKIMPPGEEFFWEGDVSEVQTMISVDDSFVRRCAEVIQEIVFLLELDRE